MNIGVTGIISFALSTMMNMEQANEEAIEKCFKDWDESKKLPRKKKKKIRKEINARYSIFSHYKSLIPSFN